MLTIDQLGMIAYILTVANIFALFVFFTRLFSFSFQSRVFNWLLLFIYAVLGVYGAQMITGLWNRYRMIIGVASGSDVGVIWAWEQFVLSLLFTCISFILLTNSLDRNIDLSRKGKH